jgi:hypothetical protein
MCFQYWNRPLGQVSARQPSSLHHESVQEGLWPGDQGYWSNRINGLLVRVGGAGMYDHYRYAGDQRFGKVLGLAPKDSANIQRWVDAKTGKSPHDASALYDEGVKASLDKLHQKNARIRVNDHLKEINVETHDLSDNWLNHVQGAIYDLHVAGHDIQNDWVVNHDPHWQASHGVSTDLRSYAHADSLGGFRMGYRQEELPNAPAKKRIVGAAWKKSVETGEVHPIIRHAFLY